jgi:hypothetical protein
METDNRSLIVTTLYNEVMLAQQRFRMAANESPEARQAAKDVVTMAVKRYVDFTFRGHMPEDMIKTEQRSCA